MPDYAVVANIEYDTDLELREENVNTTVLADWDGYEADVTMHRTLKAGSWNALTMPYALSSLFLNLMKEEYGITAVKELTGATLDGSKAHLEIPTSAGSRSFIGFGDDNTTGIELPALADDEAAEWYSLDGRRLSGKPARKGIYVKDGQKYIIK
jgi:hypothetical protein